MDYSTEKMTTQVRQWREMALPFEVFGTRAQSVLRRLQIDTIGAFFDANWEILLCPQLGGTTRCELQELQERLKNLQAQASLEDWLRLQADGKQLRPASHKVISSKPVLILLPAEDDLKLMPQGHVDVAASWPSIVCRLVKNERENYVLTRRFNLDGEGRLPLEDLGEKLKISRERVRQIEAQILLRLRKFLAGSARGKDPIIHPLFKAEVDALHSLLSAEMPLPDDWLTDILNERYSALHEQGTTRANVELLLHCLGLNSCHLRVPEAPRGLGRFWIDSRISCHSVTTLAKTALEVLRDEVTMLSRHELLEKVMAKISDEERGTLDMEQLGRIMALCPKVEEVGDDWYQIHFTELPSNKLRVERLLREWESQGKTTATVDELQTEINRRRRLAGEDEESAYQVIAASCASNPALTHIGKSGFWALKENAGDTRALHEIIEEAFVALGRPATLAELHNYVEARRALAPTSVAGLLQQHQKFQRVGRGVYALRSWGYANVPPTKRGEEHQLRFDDALLEAFIESEERPWPLSDLTAKLSQELKWPEYAVHQRLKNSLWLKFTPISGNRLLAHWNHESNKVSTPEKVTQRNRIQQVARRLLLMAPDNLLRGPTLCALIEAEVGYRRPVIYSALSVMPEVQKQGVPGSMSYKLKNPDD